MSEADGNTSISEIDTTLVEDSEYVTESSIESTSEEESTVEPVREKSVIMLRRSTETEKVARLPKYTWRWRSQQKTLQP